MASDSFPSFFVFFLFFSIHPTTKRDDTEAVVRDVCLETAKTEENVRKYIKVSAWGIALWCGIDPPDSRPRTQELFV